MIVVMFSGGIDSWGCLNWALAKFGIDGILPVYYIVGSSYNEAEHKVAEELCSRLCGRRLVTVSISDGLHEDSQGHIPFRNTMMLLRSAMFTTCTGVVFGMLKGDSSEDKNKSYVKKMQALIDSQLKATIYREVARPFKIYTPFANFTKRQLVEWCIHNAPAYGLRETVGCYSPTLHCGHCIACFNRWVARYLNNLPDETYEIHPWFFMASKINAIGELKQHNPRLFSLRQLWTKRYWAIDTFLAMHKFSRKGLKMSLKASLKWARLAEREMM